MTNIDRAGLADEIEQQIKTYRALRSPAMSVFLTYEKAEFLLASLRTTTEAQGVDGDPREAYARAVDSVQDPEAFAKWERAQRLPQPASVAGKMPSEEAVRAIIEGAVNCAIPEPWEVVDRATKEMIALLSPAEPHDVDGERVQEMHELDAGEDGAWPRGCMKLQSCARNMRCMYFRTSRPCPHHDRDISAEVEAETAARLVDEEGRRG